VLFSEKCQKPRPFLTNAASWGGGWPAGVEVGVVKGGGVLQVDTFTADVEVGEVKGGGGTSGYFHR
jgi:hypothetical protein